MRLTSTRDGFSLVELLLAIALLAILLAVSIRAITQTVNEGRYQLTIQRLTAIRKAMVGETRLKFGATRSSFGFLGDVGAIPTAAQGIAALLTNPGLPAAGWSMNSTARIGMGWNGPYLKADDSDANFLVDGWGTPFVYSPTASPPTVVSLGADRASGGTGYNADISMELSADTLTSTVFGVIVNASAPWSGNATIVLNEPNGSGGLTQLSTTVVPANNGAFSFSGVPMGVRSATVYVPSQASPTQTIGPVIFTVDRPYTLIAADLLDLAATTVGPTNLEVPIEMFDYGLSSSTVGLFSTFERSRTTLNTGNYDGTVTYSFEVLATNQSLLSQAVSIINSSGAIVNSIVVPAGVSTPTRYRVAFNPTVGTDNYRVQFPLTVLANQFSVYAARIIVNQVGATQTSVYVPLMSMNTTAVSNSDAAAIDTTSSTTYTQATPANYGIWHKEDSYFSLGSGTPFTLEVSLAGGLLGTAYAALFNRTTGLAVAGSAVSTTSLVYSLQAVSFADNASNFTDATDYEVRIASSNALQVIGIAKAGLWIHLANLGSGEAYYRIARSYSGTTSAVVNAQRALIDPTRFSNSTAYIEGVASSTSSTGTTVYPLDAGTSDAGTAGAALSGSSLAWGTTKARLRTASVTLTPGDREITQVVTGSTQTSNVTSEAVILQFHH